MKPFITTILIIFIFTSCTNKQANQDTNNNNVVINPELIKLDTDSFNIFRGNSLKQKKYPWDFFEDNNGICRLSDSILFIRTSQGFMPSHSLRIKITKGKFEIGLTEDNCTYTNHYKVIKQSLELNKSTYQVGDTLTGKLFCQAIYVWDSIKNNVDTILISGKFKLKVRDEYFNGDSLSIENNFKELIVLLSNTQPDTVTHLRLYNCGLRSLPIELKKFKNLEELELDNNDFKTADLSMFCEFKKLKSLNIDNCNLTEIPTSIFCLKNLERLDLYYNNIKVLPKELFQLIKIKELELGGNLITVIPNDILHLKDLQMLEISGDIERNNIKKLPPNFFKTLNKLTEFYPPHIMKKNEYKDFKGSIY